MFGRAHFGYCEGHRTGGFVNDDVAADVEGRTVVIRSPASRQRPAVINYGRYLAAIANLAIGRGAELNAEVLRAFKDAVVGNRDRDRLAGLARCKAQCAAGRIVVRSGNCRAVNSAEGNGRGKRRRPGLGDGEGDGAGGFVNHKVGTHVEDRTVVVGWRIARGARRYGAGTIIQNCAQCAAVGAAYGRAIGRRTQGDGEGFCAFVYFRAVSCCLDGEGLGDDTLGEGQRPAVACEVVDFGVVAAGDRGAKADTLAGLGVAGPGDREGHQTTFADADVANAKDRGGVVVGNRAGASGAGVAGHACSRRRHQCEGF